MRTWSLQRISAVALIAATLAACGQGRPVSKDSQESVALGDIKGAIASSAGQAHRDPRPGIAGDVGLGP